VQSKRSTSFKTLNHVEYNSPVMNDETVDTSIILPAYNEEEGLPLTLQSILKVLPEAKERFEILVVDDGSTDNTASIARSFPCKVISHRKNMGKGAAIITGIRNAKGRKIIFMDADNTYPAEEIPRISRELDTVDMVLTRRDSKNIRLLNLLGNKLISSFIRLLSGFKGTDPLSGLYGLKRELIEKLDIESRDFAVEAEIVVKASRMGSSIRELGINYNERAGVSKLKPFKDGFVIIKTILGLLILYNPLVTFFLPGAVLLLLGMVISALTFRKPFEAFGVRLDIHSFIFGVMSFIIGFQLMINGIIVDLYAIRHKFKKEDRLVKALNLRTLKYLLCAGVVSFIIGAGISVDSVISWVKQGFGYYFETRKVITALFFTFFGLQMIFSALAGYIFVREYLKKSR